MSQFATIASRIVKEQQSVIGPVALEVARRVKGITIEPNSLQVQFSGIKENEGVNALVKGYEQIFGLASVEVCKDAVRDLISGMDAKDIPAVLQ